MRQHVKSAGARERRSYLAETEKFLATQSKAGAPPSVIAAAIKIMGYLEDEKATSTLLEYASDAKQPPLVRQEALIALRFALGKDRGADEKKVVAALLDAAEAEDRTLAHTALHTLGSMALPGGMAKRVEKLSVHPDFERARFVLEDARSPDRRGGDAGARPRRDARSSASAPRSPPPRSLGRDDAVGPLAKALLETRGRRPRLAPQERAPPSVGEEDPERAQEANHSIWRWIDWATERADGRPSSTWSATPTPTESRPPSARSHRSSARRRTTTRRPQCTPYFCRSDRATDEDRYALASLELARGSKDTRPATRNADDSLKMLSSLLTRGFDVGTALRKDKSLEARRALLCRLPFRRSRRSPSAKRAPRGRS